MAWLPALESLTLGEDSGGWGFHITKSVDYDAYANGLRAGLGKLKNVHTFKGTCGFIDGEHPLLYGALENMSALRHLELEDSWAFDNGEDDGP